MKKIINKINKEFTILGFDGKRRICWVSVIGVVMALAILLSFGLAAVSS